MTARQSAEVTRALRLVANGSTAYAAAKKTGIALSTIYRALARNKKKAIDSEKMVQAMQDETVRLRAAKATPDK